MILYRKVYQKVAIENNDGGVPPKNTDWRLKGIWDENTSRPKNNLENYLPLLDNNKGEANKGEANKKSKSSK
jgi:hypothetical protein